MTDPPQSSLRRLVTFGTALLVLLAGMLVVTAQPASAGCRNVSIVNAYTGLAVSMEKNESGVFYGMLRARARSVGAWERFQMCIDPNTNVFTLKSLENNLYVSTEEEGYEGPYQYLLRARAKSAARPAKSR